MSPRSRSRSRSITPRRSYSRSPYRHSGRRKTYSYHKYDSRRSSSSSRPPSPPPLTSKRHSSRYSSRSVSRSISPDYRKRYNSRKHSKSRSKTKSRSRSRSRTPNDKNLRNNRDKPLPCRCIGVFGLNVYTTQQQIREIFSKFGPIERIQVITDAQTGHSRGFCFIYYENLADAKAACDNCCGMEIDGRRIRVAYSITERPHTPTPGVYKGIPAKYLRKRYRSEKQQQRHHSPITYKKSHRSSRHYYERSRSRSYTPRRYRY